MELIKDIIKNALSKIQSRTWIKVVEMDDCLHTFIMDGLVLLPPTNLFMRTIIKVCSTLYWHSHATKQITESIYKYDMLIIAGDFAAQVINTKVAG